MKDGGPAFAAGAGNATDWTFQEGMSLRDYFAAAALSTAREWTNIPPTAGNRTNSPYIGVEATHRIAAIAFVIADAMLAEREKS